MSWEEARVGREVLIRRSWRWHATESPEVIDSVEIEFDSARSAWTRSAGKIVRGRLIRRGIEKIRKTSDGWSSLVFKRILRDFLLRRWKSRRKSWKGFRQCSCMPSETVKKVFNIFLCKYLLKPCILWNIFIETARGNVRECRNFQRNM